MCSVAWHLVQARAGREGESSLLTGSSGSILAGPLEHVLGILGLLGVMGRFIGPARAWSLTILGALRQAQSHPPPIMPLITPILPWLQIQTSAPSCL